MLLSISNEINHFIPFSVGCRRVHEFIGLDSCQLNQPLQSHNNVSRLHQQLLLDTHQLETTQRTQTFELCHTSYFTPKLLPVAQHLSSCQIW